MPRRISTIAGAVLTVGLVAVPSTFAAAGDRGWEVALNHSRTQTAAKATLALVQKQSRAKGLKAVIERDGRKDYEVAITGFRTKSQAAAAQKQSKVGFPHASVEKT